MPDRTLERLLPWLDEHGITRIANVTGLDRVGIPTVMVVRPEARSLCVAQGKGCTLVAAKVSGIMESIEHAYAEQACFGLRLDSLEELEHTGEVVDVTRLPRTGRSLDPRARIPWIQGTTLEDERPVWVPHELVHLDLRHPLPPGSGLFPVSSNGLASGNTRPEAIAHGLYELVERDATTLFYQCHAAQQQRRRVDLDSIDDTVCRQLLAQLDAADVDVAVWDVTSDVPVPVFLCAVLDRDPDPLHPIGVALGAGAHLERGVALARSLCEAAQSRLTRIAGSRDDIGGEDLERVRSDGTEQRWRQWMSPPPSPARAFADSPSRTLLCFEDDLAFLCEQLQRRGLGPVLVVDLGPPDRPFRVVRVLVPGLEGLYESPQYRPGERARRGAAS